MQLVKVKVSDLKFDPDNPNILTKDQMNGLRESMKKFGYLQPIIIDSNNLVCDGSHRAQIYKEFGEKFIPAIRINFQDEQERRLLRQAMNKLKGQHDIKKDIREIQIIMHKDKHRESIKRILQVDHETIAKMKDVLEKEKEKQKNIERNANTRILDQDKRLTFYLEEKDYELVTQTLDKLSQNKNEAIVGLCNDWRSFVALQGKDKKNERIKLRQKQLAKIQ